MNAAAPVAALIEAPGVEHFAAPVCRNCGAALSTKFCGQCGQQKAARFNLRAVGGEAWSNWRLFEMDVLASAWRLLRKPGTVAREYVLGARKKHVHPLKLLLIAIGVLVLVLAQSNYLASQNANVSRAMELVRSYANWSFSLGIVAIVLTSLVVFRKRGGFNTTEHLVLAVYCHFLIICAAIVNLLPTLVWRAPAWLATHKAWSGFGMDVVEAGLVMLAFRQFFLVDLRREWWRLLLAGVVFAAIKWGLVRLYAMALVKVVMAQLT